MDKISVLALCAIFSVFIAGTSAATFPGVGCCGLAGGGFGVFSPPNVEIECHSVDREDRRVNPAFTGYGYQAAGCPDITGCGTTCKGFAGTQAHVSYVILNPSNNGYTPLIAPCVAGSGTGTYTRNWCGDSCNGGAATCSGVQSIRVVDTTPPVLGVPGTANLECGLNQYTAGTERVESGFANYYDQCTLHDILVGNLQISDAISSQLCAGSTSTPSITRTYRLTDACGLVTIDTQVINIVDTQAPVLHGVFDEIIEFNVQAPVSNPTADDRCANNPTIIQTNFVYPGRCPAESTTERVYVVSDPCGNTRRYSSILTAQDTLAPTCVDGFPVASPVTSTDFSTPCNAYPPPLSPNVVCVDSSGFTPTVTVDEYETFQLLDPDNDESREALDRTLIRNYTATDSCGNTLNWVYRYNIAQVSTITYTTGASVTILPGTNGLVTFSFQLTNCFLRRARLHYDVYPLVLTGAGSSDCQEPNGRQVVGDSFCRITNPVTLPGTVTLQVGVYVPLTFEQDKLTIRYQLTALNQLDTSAGSYGEITVHTV